MTPISIQASRVYWIMWSGLGVLFVYTFYRYLLAVCSFVRSVGAFQQEHGQFDIIVSSYHRSMGRQTNRLSVPPQPVVELSRKRLWRIWRHVCPSAKPNEPVIVAASYRPDGIRGIQERREDAGQCRTMQNNTGRYVVAWGIGGSYRGEVSGC